MIYKFKFYGHYFAIDTKSLAVHKLTEIQYDMLTYLRFPFEDVFPTTLRYDLAKYESSQLKESYFELKKLCDHGVFMSENPVRMEKKVRIEKKHADKVINYNAENFIFANQVIKCADSGFKVITVEEDKINPVKKCDFDILFSEFEKVAKEIIKRKSGRSQGDPFVFLPFDFLYEKDKNGYFHILQDNLSGIFENEIEDLEKKCASLSVAIFLE